MRAIRFTIADFGPIDGFTDGSTWNGWANVKVTPETHAKLAEFFGDETTDFGKLKPGTDGLVDLNGYCAVLEETQTANP